MANESIVESLCTIEVWKEEPDEETQADPVPVWDEVEDETEEGLNNSEAAEDHPVGEPDFVVIATIITLDRSDRMHGWVQDSHRGDEDSPTLEDHEDQQSDGSSSRENKARVHVSLRANIDEGLTHGGVWVQDSRVLLKSFLYFIHCVV